MRLDLGNGLCLVTLSKRNLLALLTKLDDPASKRMIVSGACYGSNGERVRGVQLAVRAEDDDEHYAHRPGPGGMSPDTELALRMIDEPEGWA